MTGRILSLSLAAILVLGCSADETTPTNLQQLPATVSEEQQPSSPSKTTEQFTHVITADTVYYTTGPQQARPPDGTLKAGTKVRVVRDAGSYCRVETEDGVVGYVGTDEVTGVEEEKN